LIGFIFFYQLLFNIFYSLSSGSGCTIGKNVVINKGCIIGCDVTIEENIVVAPYNVFFFFII
jgi:acetyltransferase-like isoleucine patch superfamily enzyme